MCTVTKDAIIGMFAATKVNFFCFFCLIFCRCEIAAFVGAVTERLLAAFTARAPKIVFPFFYIHGIGGFLCNNSITHIKTFHRMGPMYYFVVNLLEKSCIRQEPLRNQL
jgi:hypothetical protein